MPRRPPCCLHSTTPYVLRREAVACLLNLAQSSRSNQRLILQHEDEAHEGMAQRLFGKLLGSCGDYPMQVSGALGLLGFTRLDERLPGGALVLEDACTNLHARLFPYCMHGGEQQQCGARLPDICC
jgi:hypothetical protein